MSKKIEDKYQKKSQLEHIIDLPDTYIGSIEKGEVDLWVHDGETMVKKNINITLGLYKIFDEVLAEHLPQLLAQQWSALAHRIGRGLSFGLQPEVDAGGVPQLRG